ncbi:hypothetical protein [Paenibacillus shirakamiensis]|nr:hypothetical protein [Paenibacillus shirakamiensis]
MISNHYYITPFLTIMFFYILYHYFEDDLDYVLIRMTSYSRYFAVKAAALSVNMTLFVLIQLAVFLIIGMGLPRGSTIPPYAPDYLLLIGTYFSSPWQAICITVIYMIFGLSILATLFMTLHHFLEKRAVAVITIMLYILMVFAMKSKIQGLTRIPFLFINNYIIFMYNLSYPYALLVSLISLSMIVAGIVFFINNYWQKRTTWK